jgi:tetratricopeptide (TPR) repeat protein
MKTKIKWFKEVLELEPGSKVFFPLAKLYFEDGETDEAVSTLRSGLERNPDHLEARILLVEILMQIGELDAAQEEVEAVAGVLSNYPSFWRAWTQTMAHRSKDGALALSFLASQFQGKTISWSKIMEKGLESLFEGGEGLFGAVETSRSVRTDEATVRTRTMARILAEQGDYQGALEIYEELAEAAAGPRREELEVNAAEMREKLEQARASKSSVLEDVEEDSEEGEEAGEEESETPLPGKEKLLSTLEALADRLEARAAL